MSSPAERLDQPLIFEFRGKQFKLSRVITFEMEVAFGDWCYTRAMDRLQRQYELSRTKAAGGMSDYQYEVLLGRIGDNLSEGKFDWGGDITMSNLGQLEGNKQMILFRFQRYDPTVTLDLVNEIFKDNDAARRLGLLLHPPKDAAGKQEEKQEVPAAEATS